MGTTTNGLPYPDGTAKVRDGNDAIQALAEATDTKLLTPMATYTPTLGVGHVAGPGLLLARYRLIDPKTLHLMICYNIQSGATLPTQVVFTLPTGLTASVANLRTQSILCRYYTTGNSQYVGFASTSAAIGSDRVACYQAAPGGILGTAVLTNGSNLDINGIIDLA